MNVKKQVSAFKKKYHISALNSAVLWKALTEQGYTIIEFSNIQNSEEVATLVSALCLEEMISTSKCFTFQNENYRLVFLHDDLNDEERTVVLAHEEGHIWNGHLTKNNVFGEDVIQEFEANEFAHYLLKDKTGQNLRNKRIAIWCGVAAGVCIFAGAFILLFNGKTTDISQYYRTATGGKYHVADCVYIKGKSDISPLTQEEFNSGDYAPCSACIPNKR